MLVAVAVAYGTVLLVVSIFQRELLYQPTRASSEEIEARRPKGFITIPFRTRDGITLTGWFRPGNPHLPTILYFHGNGGDLRHRAERAEAMAAQEFGVMVFSWRGYGNNPGTPSEAGLMLDAEAALDELKKRGIESQEMIYFGESLGTGVAVQLAASHPPAAVVLESPYTSVRERAQEIYFYFPVRYVLRDAFDSLFYIRQLRSPLLIIQGETDSVIPIAHGKRLYEAAPAPKHLVSYPQFGHNDIDIGLELQEIWQFLCSTGSVPQPYCAIGPTQLP